MTVNLRSATAGDTDALLALWRRATQPTVSDDADGLRGLLARDPDAVLVVVDAAGHVVGSVIAGFDGWRGSIYRLAVDPSRQRKGLATHLVAAAEARLRALGARRSDAIVISTEGHAMSFWRPTEWVEQDHGTRFVRDKDDAAGL